MCIRDSILQVIKGIDLQIGKGELVSIMGSSGSGKSTMLNVIGILDEYDSGEYRLDNMLIKGQSETENAALRSKYIGFIFQSFNLIGDLTVFENVELPLTYRGTSAAERKKRAYLSSVLSRNEIDRDYAYNRRLFARMAHGHYVLNPLLAIKSGEAWINLYDFLNLPLLYEGVQGFNSPARYFLDRLIRLRERLLGHAPPDEDEEEEGCE